MSYLSLPRPTCPAIDPPLVWHPISIQRTEVADIAGGNIEDLWQRPSASRPEQPWTRSASERFRTTRLRVEDDLLGSFKLVLLTQVPTHGQRLGSMEVQRLGSMEVYEAAKNQEWINVEVRRPLEADFSFKCGPSRGVWGLVSGPLKPSSHAGFGLAMLNPPPIRRVEPAGNFDFACRRSSMPVTTRIPMTRALPCLIAEPHNFPPPPSPAISVSAPY